MQSAWFSLSTQKLRTQGCSCRAARAPKVTAAHYIDAIGGEAILDEIDAHMISRFVAFKHREQDSAHVFLLTEAMQAMQLDGSDCTSAGSG
jgi:hypothetical protein